MNRKHISTLALALVTLAAGNAFAADTSMALTRDQVQAELVQAQRTGNLIAVGDRDQKLNQLNPTQYSAKSMDESYTRAQVKAELALAERNGNIVAPGDNDQKLNQLNPSQYPAMEMAHNVTRAEVAAEVAQAQREGTLLIRDTNSNS